MKNVKIPTSDSWHDSLVDTLYQDSEKAAAYIEVALEDGGDDPRLLPAVIKDVIEAQKRHNNLSVSAKEKWENFEKILSESKCAEIYALVELLDALGFKLGVSVKSENESEGNAGV